MVPEARESVFTIIRFQIQFIQYSNSDILADGCCLVTGKSACILEGGQVNVVVAVELHDGNAHLWVPCCEVPKLHPPCMCDPTFFMMA